MKKYYVVTGVWRENNIREIINGFYARREALNEAGYHRHTHKSIRIRIITDTPGALDELVHQLQAEAI